MLPLTGGRPRSSSWHRLILHRDCHPVKFNYSLYSRAVQFGRADPVVCVPRI